MSNNNQHTPQELHNIELINKFNQHIHTNRISIGCVYHHKDLDGCTSGYLMNILFNNLFNYLGPDAHIPAIGMIPYDHNDRFPIDEINQFDVVIFVDITPPIDLYVPVLKNPKNKGVIIIDHHKTSLDDYLLQDIDPILERKLHYLFSEHYSAAQMVLWLLACDDNVVNHIEYRSNIFSSKPLNDILYRILYNIVGLVHYDFPSDQVTDGLLFNSIVYKHFLVEFVKIVDLYDTWKWENVNPANPYYTALLLNDLFHEHFNRSILDSYESIKTPNIKVDYKSIYALVAYFIQIIFPSRINEKFPTVEDCFNLPSIIINNNKISSITRKFEENMETEYSYVIWKFRDKYHNEYNVAILNDVRLSFYVKNKLRNSGENIDFIVSLTPNYEKKVFAMSIRGIDPTVNCGKLAKDYFNGGGHFGAAGGEISFAKPLISDIGTGVFYQ